MDGRIDRRDFIKGSTAMAGSCLAWGSLDLARAQGAKTLVRRDVTKLTEAELAPLVAGVKAMKARAAGDPTSWEAQAGIHLNRCEHGNWFFLPWHRAYLHFFEAVCRAASGDPSFALPYWDWTANPLVPAPFWGQPENPLFHRRLARPGGPPARRENVGKPVIDDLLDIVDWETFGGSPAQRGERAVSGQLEGVPHNYIHNYVGGSMSTMRSPLDPIFWLHHANVDRLWNLWLARGGGRANPAETAWVGAELADFVGADGKPAKLVVRDLLDTVKLGYRYDTDPEGAIDVSMSELRPSTPLLEASNKLPVWGRTPLTLTMAKLDKGVLTTSLERMDTVRVQLEVDVPKDPSVAVRVYLNCDYLGPETGTEVPHYVGTLSFFEGEHAGHDHNHSDKRRFYLRLNPALARLREAEQDPLTGLRVQLLLLHDTREEKSVKTELVPGVVKVSRVGFPR